MIKLPSWKAGLALALLGVVSPIVDYIGYSMHGLMPIPNFIGLIFGIGLIFFTLGVGIVWRINANYRIEKVEGSHASQNNTP